MEALSQLYLMKRLHHNLRLTISYKNVILSNEEEGFMNFTQAYKGHVQVSMQGGLCY